MVHTAIGYAKANHRLATLACTASIGPGATNMVTGAATATINRLPVLLLPSDYYATRHQGPVLQQLEHPDLGRRERERLLPARQPLLRSHHAGPNNCSTALPEAMRVLTDPAETGAVTLALAAGRAGPCLRLPRRISSISDVWRIERRLPDPQRIERSGRRCSRRPSGRSSSRAAACIIPKRGTSSSNLPKAFGIPVGETFAGKGAPARSVAELRWAASASQAIRRGREDRQPGRPGDLRRNPSDRFRHRLAVVLPQSGRAVHQHQRLRRTMPTSKAPCR